MITIIAGTHALFARLKSMERSPITPMVLVLSLSCLMDKKRCCGNPRKTVSRYGRIRFGIYHLPPWDICTSGLKARTSKLRVKEKKVIIIIIMHVLT